MTPVRVMIRLAHNQQWSPVGQVAVEVDPESGMTLLRLDLCAMAPRLYLPLADLLALSAPQAVLALVPDNAVAACA